MNIGLEHEQSDWEPTEFILSAQHTLEHPLEVTLPNGKLAAGTRQGSHIKEVDESAEKRRPNTNEDRALIQILPPDLVIFAIADAHEHSQAGGVAIQQFRSGLLPALSPEDKEAQKRSMERVHANTSQAMAQQLEAEVPGRPVRGGVCYLAGRIVGDDLSGPYAGDVQLIVIRNGKIVFITEPQHAIDDHSLIPNEHRISTKGPGIPTFFPDQDNHITLQSGDIVIAATDGFFAIVTNLHEFARQVEKRNLTDPREILQFMNQGVSFYHENRGETDDVTAVVYVHKSDQKTS